jgi:hypothetical protein
MIAFIAEYIEVMKIKKKTLFLKFFVFIQETMWTSVALVFIEYSNSNNVLKQSSYRCHISKKSPLKQRMSSLLNGPKPIAKLDGCTFENICFYATINHAVFIFFSFVLICLQVIKLKVQI